MSLFKIQAIVLEIKKKQKNDFLYQVFSKDYGKIWVEKKKNAKEKALDLGYIINAELKTKEERQVHKIQNIKITSEFDSSEKDFLIIETYLQTLFLILKETPFWVAIPEIFEIIVNINKEKNLTLQKLIISRLKIKAILGILSLENNNETIQKILNFIYKNKIETIFRLEQLDDNIQEKLLFLAK